MRTFSLKMLAILLTSKTAPEVCQARALWLTHFYGCSDTANILSRLPSGQQWNESLVPQTQNSKLHAEDFIPANTPQTNASTSVGDVFSRLEASKIGGLEMFSQTPLFNEFKGNSFTPPAPQAVPATSDLLICPQTLGFMGKLDDFIVTLSSNEDALVGATSRVPNNITQTGLGNRGMNGIMQEIDGLDFSCMGTGTDESSFNGTLGTDFLGSPAVENMSGLHLPAPATQDSSLRGSYGVVTEPEVSIPLVNNNIVKPTGVTTTLLNGISLSLLLSSSCGYTPSLPARFGPSALDQRHQQGAHPASIPLISEAYGTPRQPQPECKWWFHDSDGY